MSGGGSYRRVYLIPFVLFLSLFLAASTMSDVYHPYVEFQVPAKDHDLGNFVKNQPMDLDFNLTFDYPFNVTGNQSTVTAEIFRVGEGISSKMLYLKPYLEKYNILTNGLYVFRPVYFNFSATVEGRNYTYTPIEFNYDVEQKQRDPYPWEGENDFKNRWKVYGRVVQGIPVTDFQGHYCSGPWDFDDSQPTGFLCNRHVGFLQCTKGKYTYPEVGSTACTQHTQCCSYGWLDSPYSPGICVPAPGCRGATYNCTRSGLNGDCVGDEAPCTCNKDCCIEHGRVGYVCFGGTCTEYERTYQIDRSSWDDFGGKDWKTVPMQKGAILYYEFTDSNYVPNDPVVDKSWDLGWGTAHSWKIETYVHTVRRLLGSVQFRMYPDDGARFYVYRQNLGTGSWDVQFNWSCRSELAQKGGFQSIGCPFDMGLEPDSWYRIEFYLYNDPFGRTSGGGEGETGDEGENPVGLRVESEQAKDASLLDILGNGAFMSSEAPGANGLHITGKASVLANQGLKEVRNFYYFSTNHVRSDNLCDNDEVWCSLREACGNDEYLGIKTNKYGWITHLGFNPDQWDNVGGDPTKKTGFIKSGNSNVNFDRKSIDTQRDLYVREWLGERKKVGGLYECKKADDWASWETDCVADNRYSYIKGAYEMRCCLMKFSVSTDGATGDDKITLNDYKGYGYSYIANFLPPFDDSTRGGNKLCVLVKSSATLDYTEGVLYQSNFTNQFCDIKTGTGKCCYCRPGWGCRLDCINELNQSASSTFALPFPTVGPLWELKRVKLKLKGTEPLTKIDLNYTGNEIDGWNILAKLGENADKILDKNYTIPFNLFDDFGFRVPGERKKYTLVLTATYNMTSGNTSIQYNKIRNYGFSVVDCLREGEKQYYYDDATYPGTKGKGACKPGLRTCKNLSNTYLRWEYETSNDLPVYPSPEACNGIDDDCDGIVDDVMSFDLMINEIIVSGGKKNPYQVTQCGCFMGAPASPEKCNSIDDDCNGVVDDAQGKVWINTCDAAVQQCMKDGSPYEWCKKLYNSSSCNLAETPVTVSGNVTLNTCTEKVRQCMNIRRIQYISIVDDNYVLRENLTYLECSHYYQNTSTCRFEQKKFTVLSDTCSCTASSPSEEACNGIDDNCNGRVDDVPAIETCGCALLTDADIIHRLKAGGDASCDGIDSDCNGVIDDGAKDCACARRSPNESVEIKWNVKEKCDGMDNDCNGLADESFPNVGKTCGYGACAGGNYVCNVHGDEAVCNTTVNPDETFSGKAIKLKHDETCDLRDNDCDYSIDEDCYCSPEGVIKLCGYESGIYYKSRQQLDDVCADVVDELKKMITWAEAPENVKYRRIITVKNNDNVDLKGYPINVSIGSGFLIENGKLRSDGGDLRIIPAGEEKNLAWSNSTPFKRSKTTVWFKTDLAPNQEKKFYLYYGSPMATYIPVSLSEVTGLDYARGLFLLCHFDNSTVCEGNMYPKNVYGVTFVEDTRDLMEETVPVQGAYIDGVDKLLYPTSENFNKNRGTIMMWVKPTDLTEEHYLFYSKDFNGGNQFSLYLSENGTVFQVFDKTGKNYTINAGIINLEWHHIAATWDNLKGISLYVDGVQKATKSVTWEANDIGLDVYIGGEGTSKTAYSLIDELAVYSQAFDQAAIREKMRYYQPYSSLGQEETINETIAEEEVDIYEKCTSMLENITSEDSEKKATVLGLCDSVRICQKTDFPVSSVSECTFGTQACEGTEWNNCTAMMPKTELCNMKDDDCNAEIDDIAVPETCACSNGGKPSIEVCNGIDDDCNGVVDDVKGGASIEATHCGCFDQIVNITQKTNETETACNGIDDNCNGLIDENLEKCACAGTVFGPYNNTWATAISVEKCDDIDNDCSGVIDDPWQQGGSSVNKFEFLGASCSPLNSRCIGGMFVCSKDGTGIVCSTTSNEGIAGSDLRMNETCNALDDDCDGKIDNVWGDISNKFCRCYNGVPRGEETCNGIDDDCNGLIDDGLTDCGCSIDMEVNANNMNQLAVMISTKKASGEICNNIDDDCNGLIDDGLEGKCFCSGGFAGNAAAKPEFCNGIDDDCDGRIDNVANTAACACYNGTHKSGELQEICDGIDNDCNGLIDEDWPTLGGACGMGACSGGVYECSQNKETAVCSTEKGGSQDKAIDEECGDNIDNDCNGVIDENCICDVDGEQRKCSADVGECREGIQTCADKKWSNCIGGIMPVPETCDRKDNNCNDVIDDLPAGGCGCYGGADKTTETCDGVDNDCNGIVDDIGGKDSVDETKCGCYDNAYAKGAKPETCNMIDDDCDGVIDNVRDGASVEAARCACYNDALPGVESCNKIDDDCDEATDEDWANVGQTCGDGICAGVFICSEDGKTLVCNGGQPATEVCDEKDNNCDGRIDEGCLGGAEVGSCENGMQDGKEEGIDCGGSCPNPCAGPTQPIQSGTWMIVFIALVVVIVAVGIVLVFVKP
jgi:hypothetical protein